ncbi:hypothetical protein [Candidatus Nitrososphaera sp. FF02]
MYGQPLCEKCLHPLDRHGLVLTRTQDREIRRCEIGVCSCVIMK